MKKGLKVLLCLFCVMTLTACSFNLTKDEAKFKEEYESLNGKKSESGKTYHTLDFDDNTNVIYQTEEEIVTLLKEGTGVIYLGFPECPWCRSMLPVLLDVLEETDEPLYYLNAKEIRDEKKLDENKEIVTTKEGTKSYQEMLKLLDEYLDPYEGLNDPSIKRIYLPTVIFVKDGDIEAVHSGTVSSQEDPYKSLTDSEEDELEAIFENGLSSITNATCSRNGC